MRQLAIEQAEREGHERRSAQVAAVWDNRTKEERDEIARKAIAAGRKTRHSPERRRISAQRLRDRWEVMTQEQKDPQIKRLLTGRGKKATEIEIAVAAVLDVLNIPYEFEFFLDRFVVDFYIPSLNTVIEADGEYWHRSLETQAKDQERDARLTRLGYRVVRLSEQAIKEDALKAVVHGLLWENKRGVQSFIVDFVQH
jgi:very-short-patch-repair endonuclease